MAPKGPAWDQFRAPELLDAILGHLMGSKMRAKMRSRAPRAPQGAPRHPRDVAKLPPRAPEAPWGSTQGPQETKSQLAGAALDSELSAPRAATLATPILPYRSAFFIPKFNVILDPFPVRFSASGGQHSQQCADRPQCTAMFRCVRGLVGASWELLNGAAARETIFVRSCVTPRETTI